MSDTPIFDGKISTTSETAIVSHAIPSLEIIEFYGDKVHLIFFRYSPLNRKKLEVLALLGVDPFTCLGIF